MKRTGISASLRRFRWRGSVLAWALVLAAQALGGPPGFSAEITTPMEEFGFNLGDDYQLANYSQLERYWQKLAVESDRMSLEVIGRTAEGRPMYMAVITSPENHRNLDRYREIARRLALAGDLTESGARLLASEGRAIVWIDGGIHADETLGAQQLMELVYRLVSSSDEETLRVLDETILLAVCSNPDGLELVANWYMRRPVPEERSLDGLPRLYQKYAGHDNNRDFYMSSQPETEAINRVLYREWFPEIVYNHHQSGPSGTVLFAPPFRDPFNYNIDPLIVTSLDLVAGAMHSRFLAEDKPGATMRSGANYSTWWNGGLRTSPYFHNMIGLLTETIGSPTPSIIPADLAMRVPRGDYPSPVEPGVWHLSQSVDYSITADLAVLDFASRYRDTLLFNIWRMGMNSIERGSGDHWTITPADVARVEAMKVADAETAFRLLRPPSERDPRGYILSADQPDFLTATRFVNALIKNGVEAERATADFSVGSRRYPAGSYVVKTAQAFRPQVMDMFEPQEHPDDFAYPGAPPTAPYDTAGWTLAYQMGVRFDRILDGFDGPFERIPDPIEMPPGRVEGPPRPAGFFLSHDTNDSFVAINRLTRGGEEVYWLTAPVEIGGRFWPEGTIYIPARGDETDETMDLLRDLASRSGLVFEGVSEEPRVPALRLRPVRIGLWDEYGGAETSGWMRFVLENFEFPFQIVYAPQLDSGDLSRDFDVLIFPDGAVPANSRSRLPVRPPDLEGELGATYRERAGGVSVAGTVPKLAEFLENGGAILSVGGSTALARHLDLPVENAVAGYTREEFYIPGSVLSTRVDTRQPLGYGLSRETDVLFDESPAFRLGEHAAESGIRTVATYVRDPLRSGWAWGEDVLEGTSAVVDIPVGAGRLILFGPEINFRAQSHGTFKLLFNGIYYPGAVPVILGRD